MSKKDLSKKNPLAISHERRLELEHFCKQYPEWLAEYNDPVGVKAVQWVEEKLDLKLDHSNPTEAIALRKKWLSERLDLIECTAGTAVESVIDYGAVNGRKTYCLVLDKLILAVTHGLGYSKLGIEDCISEYQYQKMYRYFFYILDKRRD